ncbi:MAG: SWIM zinc finger family protein [Methanoregulaceae archaeon]|jgi:predicted nucleic acid-binding Zn finger protein|nr:SWIM zinc finger family protein [Methanoregulaceae archaeon]MCU0628274.1 SWIM zinc finger family protein [Methanoregulaceae archaeon]
MDVEHLFELLAERKSLTPELCDEIIRIYGERGRKALQAIDERRIKKYRDFFIVVGASDEYIVDEDFCTCRDFIFRKGRCWHELAVKIAAAIGSFDEIELWYQDTWIGDDPPDKQYLS